MPTCCPGSSWPGRLSVHRAARQPGNDTNASSLPLGESNLSWGTPPACPAASPDSPRSTTKRLVRLLRRVVTQGPSQQRWRDELVVASPPTASPRTGHSTADVVSPAGSNDRSRGGVGPDEHRTSTGSPRSSAPPPPSPSWRNFGDRRRAPIEEHAALLAGQVWNRWSPPSPARRSGAPAGSTRATATRNCASAATANRRRAVSTAPGRAVRARARACIEGRPAMSRAGPDRRAATPAGAHLTVAAGFPTLPS